MKIDKLLKELEEIIKHFPNADVSTYKNGIYIKIKEVKK